MVQVHTSYISHGYKSWFIQVVNELNISYYKRVILSRQVKNQFYHGSSRCPVSNPVRPGFLLRQQIV